MNFNQRIWDSNRSATRRRAKAWRSRTWRSISGWVQKRKTRRLKREIIPLGRYFEFLRNNNLRENRRHRKLACTWRKPSNFHRSQMSERTLCGGALRDHSSQQCSENREDNGAHETRRSNIKQINPSWPMQPSPLVVDDSLVIYLSQQVYI